MAVSIARNASDREYLSVMVAKLGPVLRLSMVCRLQLDLTSWPGPRDRLERMAETGWLRREKEAGAVVYRLTPAGSAVCS